MPNDAPYNPDSVAPDAGDDADNLARKLVRILYDAAEGDYPLAATQ